MWKSGLRADKRGVVAIWIAVMLPGLIMAISMGIEISNWAAAQVSVQRTADLAAIAGAINYKNNTGAAQATREQTAATFAARFAQINGGNGTAAPAWTASTKTLADNQITVQVTTGLQSSSNAALKVTVLKSVPKTISQFFSAGTSVTVSSTSTAELVIVGTAGSGGQPCLVALSTSTGVITGQGSTYLTMPNCTIRSNGTIGIHGGGGPITTAGIYAAGAVSIDTWIATTGGQNPNSGIIIDPYLSNTALQNAFSNTLALTGVTNINCGTVSGVLGTPGQYTGNNNCNGTNTLPNGGTCVTSGGVTCTLYPGNYGSFNVPSGGPYTFNFQPGLYQFKGAISLQGNTTSNGSGVTIIMTGAFNGSNSFNFNITAPTVAQASSTGGVAAIALAGNSATTTTISGNAAFNVTGVTYFPNAIFDASGSSCNSSTPCFGSNSTTCLEIIASSIKLTGNANFNSSCASLGAATFTSVAGSSTTAAGLVR